MNEFLRKKIYESWFIASGIYYGYPLCCAMAMDKDYCFDAKNAYPEGPWMGSGFIPCLDCAVNALPNFTRFVERHITPNRICETAFPNGELSSAELNHEETIELIESFYRQKQGVRNDCRN